MSYYLFFVFFVIIKLNFAIEKPLVIELLNNPVYTSTYSENKSLNYLIKNFFIHQLKLNVEFKEISYKDLEKNLLDKNKDTMILSSIILFFIILSISIYLYKEKLYQKKLLKDSLTGLSNRFVFDEFCKNYNNILGYTFIIDLNNLKKINDFYGHEVGDSIIKEFGTFLKCKFLKEFIFRISGDEFYIFSFESHENIIEKIKKYQNYCPTLLKNDVTFNLGICQKTSDISLKTSFRYADLAMLETKKNRDFFYKIADKKFLEKINRENYILDLLKEDTSNIYPEYQPKYCIKNQKIIGAEALARYKKDNKNFIYPSEFIPIAEKYNFIYKIDYKIAKESIKFIAELLKNKVNLKTFRISFNLSISTFKRSDLIDVISNLLEEYNVPGRYLEIEITESIFILDVKELITKLKKLKSLGIQISLDDFTAGHSTAGILPLLPLDIIKFDKTLLDSVELHKNKGEIVFKNLTKLVKDLKLKIVVEGVEDKEQVKFLKELNLDYAQGFYYSKPIIKEIFMEMMVKDNLIYREI